MAERICSVDGCNKKHWARGWCQGHYVRWKTTGDPGTTLLEQRTRWSGQCAVEGCERDAKVRRWCRGHYTRWYKTGDPGPAKFGRPKPAPKPPKIKPPRVSDFPCMVDDCPKMRKTGLYCSAHYTRWIRWGDPLGSAPKRPRVRRPSNGRPEWSPNWRGDDAAYSTIHSRLRTQRGNARNLLCEHCGSQANTWAYDHEDPNEKTDRYNGFPYSTDLDHYMPLCKRCHSTFDRGYRRRMNRDQSQPQRGSLARSDSPVRAALGGQ